jgi:hypothetical protein
VRALWTKVGVAWIWQGPKDVHQAAETVGAAWRFKLEQKQQKAHWQIDSNWSNPKNGKEDETRRARWPLGIPSGSRVVATS